VTVHLVYATDEGPGVGARLRRRATLLAQRGGIPFSLVGRRDSVDVSRWPERSPVIIAARLFDALQARGPVRLYDWTERVSIRGGPNDVLLGHPGSADFVWNRSFNEGRSGARIALFPLSHGMPEANTYFEPFVQRVDAILGIMGSYWWDTWRAGPFAHWADKLTPVDMAIDAARFPRVKTSFNPPGRRTFLYIGRDGPQKGTHLLSTLFGLAKRHRCIWIGPGRPIPHVEARGFAHLTPAYMRRLAEECDVFITMGVSDANPTTILEAMAWGFPVCNTPESGYHRLPELIGLSTTDMQHNLAVLDRMQDAPEAELRTQADLARARVERDFGWDRFLGTVLGAVERVCRAKGFDPWPGPPVTAPRSATSPSARPP
jgi:glycosyltransferase involved in cell wall biosynthesis